MSESAATVLQIADLAVVRAGAPLPELERFSLELKRAETAVVLGETGCGKEALFRALCGVSRPDERVTGSIRFGAQTALSPGRQGSGIRVAYLPCVDQGVLSPSADVLSQLVRILARRLGLPRASAREELRLALGRIEGAPPIASLRGRSAALDPGVLAWGFLAVALAQSPDLVLADHALSHLSPMQARNLASALLSAQKQLGFALLYAARGTLATAWLGGRVLVMRAGKIVEEGPVERLASPHAHAYTQMLYKSAIVQSPARKHTIRGEPVLQVRGLKLAADRERTSAGEGLTFDLRRGAALAIVGEPGSGRRELMRAMLGLDKPAAGRTILDSVDIGILSRAMVSRLRRRIAFITGDDDVLDPRMTVRDTVEEPLRAHLNLSREHVAGYREAALKRVGLNTIVGERTVATLSSFDRRRLQIARAIVSAPRLAVIEEPQRGLGPLEQSAMIDLLKDFRAQEGPAFLVLTANLALARALADDAMVVRNRQVIERGSLADLVQAPQDPYTKSLIEAVMPRPDTGLSQAVLQG